MRAVIRSPMSLKAAVWPETYATASPPATALGTTCDRSRSTRSSVASACGAVVGVHGDYYGGTVNLAARLVRAADPGAIVVSEAVRAEAPSFAFTPLELGPLKGFPGPVPAFRLQP